MLRRQAIARAGLVLTEATVRTMEGQVREQEVVMCIPV